MIIWFKILVVMMILAIAVFTSIYIWNYLPDYKKIRIYISTDTIRDIKYQLLHHNIDFEKEYSMEGVRDNLYKIIFVNQKRTACYNVKILIEGKFTIVLVQYDKYSKGRPLRFELLDQFILSKMTVKLK